MGSDDDADDSEARFWLWANLSPGRRLRFAVIGPYPSWQEAADAAERAPNVLDLDPRIRSAWQVDETEPTTDCEIHRIDEGDNGDDWFA
ncbi:hypothetical protein [Actinoplanes sp. G11-F43]|uniref:hypothetical protein n=1 Tax=Actinoplanes sp. G11-F43 TaxID=3424130 RepID=UPI003D352AE4